jgi:hypothetical protein
MPLNSFYSNHRKTDSVLQQILPSQSSERPILYTSKYFLVWAPNDLFCTPANTSLSELRTTKFKACKSFFVRTQNNLICTPQNYSKSELRKTFSVRLQIIPIQSTETPKMFSSKYFLIRAPNELFCTPLNTS